MLSAIIKRLLQDRKAPLIILIVWVLVVIVAGFYIYSLQKKLSLAVSKQKAVSEGYTQETSTIKADYNKLLNDYEQLKKGYEAISLDRDNLLIQIKKFVADKNRAEELAALVETLRKDIENLEKEKQDAAVANNDLQKKLEEFKSIQKQLLTEKEQLQEALKRERDKSNVASLEQANSNLQKESAGLAKNLAQAQEELKRSKESQAKILGELKNTTDELKRYKKEYADAVKKNKMFEKKLANLPARVTELARQHKSLIRQTATMHYNLGVFYTNQKEYSRAIAEFEKAIELIPEDAASHFNLGYIYAEYFNQRNKAIEHFRKYLRFAKQDDRDLDWVKKYIVTWQAWEGKVPME